MSVIVRRGTAAEVIGVRHEVLRPGRPKETAVFPGDDAADTRHWVADVDGSVVGVVTIIAAVEPEAVGAPAAWQLRGMAVSTALQGGGVGAALVEAVYHEVAEPLWCNARAKAIPFYARLGWRITSEPFEVAGIGPHRRMRWDG